MSGQGDALGRAKELSRRLHLLVDLHAAEEGASLEISVLQAFLKADGLNLSQSRWFYMLNGSGPLTSDDRLLSAIAEFFKVPTSFLTDWGTVELPDRLDAALEVVKAVREKKLIAYATRALGQISPEGIQLLNDLIEQELANDRSQGESSADQSS